LALGIGVTTAVFTFVDAGLLRAVNLPDADRLVKVDMLRRGESTRIQAATRSKREPGMIRPPIRQSSHSG
jgi:hypothetical protein